MTVPHSDITADVAVVKVAAIIASVGAIVTFVYRVGKAIIQLSKMVDRFNALEMNVLRLIIINPEMPTEVRVKAGEEYVALGGNGIIKRTVEQLIEDKPMCRRSTDEQAS